MMTVFMDQIVDEVEVVTVEAVDERQARPMTVAKADDAGCLERYDT